MSDPWLRDTLKKAFAEDDAARRDFEIWEADVRSGSVRAAMWFAKSTSRCSRCSKSQIFRQKFRSAGTIG